MVCFNFILARKWYHLWKTSEENAGLGFAHQIDALRRPSLKPDLSQRRVSSNGFFILTVLISGRDKLIDEITFQPPPLIAQVIETTLWHVSTHSRESVQCLSCVFLLRSNADHVIRMMTTLDCDDINCSIPFSIALTVDRCSCRRTVIWTFIPSVQRTILASRLSRLKIVMWSWT